MYSTVCSSTQQENWIEVQISTFLGAGSEPRTRIQSHINCVCRPPTCLTKTKREGKEVALVAVLADVVKPQFHDNNNCLVFFHVSIFQLLVPEVNHSGEKKILRTHKILLHSSTLITDMDGYFPPENRNNINPNR